MKVVISSTAEADLLQIGIWIAEDNPSRAETFLDEMRAKCLALANAPRGYPLLERYKKQKFRRRPYKDYLIFYRIGRGQIEIVRILHGARDYDKILSDKTV